MRILLIDDDEQSIEVLANKLIEQHYAVDIAITGEMGWEFILLFDYDLVVLDWMLPDIDGIALCQQIRSEGYQMPIILLSARDRPVDRVMGLDTGADDYVVKPFDFDELTARIRALLRREIHVGSPILKWKNLSLDPKTYEVKFQDRLVPLTPKEYALIELFMRHPQQVFSPGAIIENLWAGEDPPGEEAVRTHIKGLRQKLKSVGMPKDAIKTVYGIGYRLKSDTDTNEEQTRQKTDKSQQIADAWMFFKDTTFERLAILKNLAEALTEDRDARELQVSAKSSAHKLAGSLGGFGFPEGSKIAKQIEKLLEDSLSEGDRTRFTELIASLEAELQHQPFEAVVSKALGKNIAFLIVDRDGDFSQQLVTEALKMSVTTYTASNPDLAREIITQKSPAAIVYKIRFPDGEDLAFVEQLHRQKPQLPIVIIVEEAQLLDRLEVVRKGGNSIFQHPVEPRLVISAAIELVQNAGEAAKVLIVDDDPQVLLSLKIALEPWGFELTTLNKSTQVWKVLEKVNPDLLVLDVEMPEINGMELCQILRSDRRWRQLPILFLTVHHDKKTEYQAFAIGADDYISKPVIASELANRILNRLRRSKLNY